MKKLGRPNIPDDKKRVRLNTTIAPDVMDFINSKKETMSYGQYIDMIIRLYKENILK